MVLHDPHLRIAAEVDPGLGRAIGLVKTVLNLLDGQVKFFKGIQQMNCNQPC